MASEEIGIRVKLEGDIAGQMRRAAGDVEKSTKQMETGAKGVANAFKAIGAAAVAGLAVRELVKLGKESIDLAKRQAQAEAQLTSALGRTSKGLLAYASELQKVTTFGDEATIEAAALLGAFVKEEEQIKKLLPVIQDLAAAKGMDLTAAADLVAKSVGSSTNALSRYGIEIKGAAGSTERAESAVAAITEKFGGMAQAIADTPFGELEQMENQLGDIKELLGTELVPILIEVNKWVLKWAEGVKIIFGLESATEKAKKRFGELNDEVRMQKAVVQNAEKLGLTQEQIATATELLNKKLKEQAELMQSLYGADQKAPGGGGGGGGDKKTPAGQPSVNEMQQYYADIDAINKEAAEWALEQLRQQKEEKQQIWEDELQLQLDYIDIVADAEKWALEQYKQTQDARRNETKKTYETEDKIAAASLQTASSFFGGITDLLENAAHENEEAANAYKAIATAQAIIDTFAAANAAYKAMAGIPYVGPALGIAASAAAIASGVANVASIQSQTFATGGVVGGNSFSGDNVSARVNSGEMILNRSQQQNLFNAIDSGNVGGGGGGITVSDTIVINGNADEGAIAAIAQTREDQIEKMRELMIEMQQIGQLPMAA